MSAGGAARAQHLVDLGRYADAREAITAALAAEPDDAHLHGLMAQALLALGDLRQALAHANQVVRLRPDDEWGHRLASIALVRLDQLVESTRAAAEAVRLAPLNWRSHQAYALAASEMPAGFLDAASAAERAVALAPGEAGAHFAAGLVAQRRRQHLVAIAAYERVLRIEPDHADALNNLTVVRDRRHLGRAARGYSGSLRLDPHSRVTQHNVVQLGVRFLRRIYFASLVAVVAGVVASASSDGQVGVATLSVATITVVGASAYTVVVFRGVPAGLRRFLRSRLLRTPFLALTLTLTSAMFLLALVTCLVPDGYAVAVSLLAPLGLLNVGFAIWSRTRSVPR